MKWYDVDYILTTFFACVIFGGVIVLVSTLMMMIHVSVNGELQTETNPIVSLERKSTINGSFFLGTGTISEATYFFFYREVAPNQYILSRTRTSRTIIEESNSKTPVHIDKSQRCKPVWIIGELCVGAHPNEQLNILVVPKGTIIKNFTAHPRN